MLVFSVLVNQTRLRLMALRRPAQTAIVAALLNQKPYGAFHYCQLPVQNHLLTE